jgi:hypothetical protein
MRFSENLKPVEKIPLSQFWSGPPSIASKKRVAWGSGSGFRVQGSGFGV